MSKKIQKMKRLPDLNLSVAEMDSIKEKIADLINHGLNCREIANGLPKGVTKAHLIRVICDYITRPNICLIK